MLRRLLAPLLFALPFLLHAQAPPADDEEFWTVGIAAFEGRRLAAENQYLAHSIPLMLQERLESIHTHFFTGEEKLGYQRAVIQRERRRQGKLLETLRRERDALFFRKAGSTERQEMMATYGQKIQQAVDRLNYLKGLSPDAVPYPDKKEVRFAAGEKEGALLAAPEHSPLQAARLQPVNLLIWGRFEEVQGYLYFEVRAVDAALEREVFFYSDAVTREQLAAVLKPVADELSRVLWGKDWASLYVQAEPLEARIYMDGELIGTGQARVDFLSPGEKQIRVQLPGFETQVKKVSLAPYVVSEIRMALEKSEKAAVLLSSQPDGAAIYQGSSWLGLTPLEVARPDFAARFLLRREGYLDSVLYLDARSLPQVTLKLTPSLLDPVQDQKSKRDRFYASFGLFALTLPLPVLFWGYANDFALGSQSAALAGNWEEAMRFYDAGYGYYYAYLGTLGLSAALLVNMMVHLIRYIQSADRKA